MPTRRKSPCRECRTPTQTRSGICIDCDPPNKQKRHCVVHRSATYEGVIHAVYEKWTDGGTIARCGAKFVCSQFDDVPACRLSCHACKLKARGYGKSAIDVAD